MEALLVDAERALVASAFADDQADNQADGQADDNNHNNKPLPHNNSTTTTNASNNNNSELSKPSRGHRAQSQVWKFLTREENPHRATRSACMHCRQDVPHHRKSEKARAHLLRCLAFRAYMATVEDASARPHWFDYEPVKVKKSKAATKSTGGNEDGGMAVVPTAQQKPLEHHQHVQIPSGGMSAATTAIRSPVVAIASPPVPVVPTLLVKRRMDHNTTAPTASTINTNTTTTTSSSNKRQTTGHKTTDTSSVFTSHPSSNNPATTSVSSSIRRPTAAKKHKKLLPAPPPSSTQSVATPPLSDSAEVVPDLLKVHAALAMFFYMTATPFARIDNHHLQKAFKASNPSVTLPSSSQLAGPLLDQAFVQTQTQVNAALSAFEFNSIVVNGWSSSLSSSVTGSGQRVDYVVVNEQHAFLLETSVLGVEQRQDADLLAHKMIGIMNRCGRPISGTVPVYVDCFSIAANSGV